MAFSTSNLLWEYKFMNWIQNCPLVLLISDAQWCHILQKLFLGTTAKRYVFWIEHSPSIKGNIRKLQQLWGRTQMARSYWGDAEARGWNHRENLRVTVSKQFQPHFRKPGIPSMGGGRTGAPGGLSCLLIFPGRLWFSDTTKDYSMS